MATSSKKSKATSKKAAATPAKKAVAVATKKTVPTLAKKMSSPKTEKHTSKPRLRKAQPKRASRKTPLLPEERYHMIATAAYFRAQHRGFVCCCAKEDWISGEAQIDAMLNA